MKLIIAILMLSSLTAYSQENTLHLVVASSIPATNQTIIFEFVKTLIGDTEAIELKNCVQYQEVSNTNNVYGYFQLDLNWLAIKQNKTTNNISRAYIVAWAKENVKPWLSYIRVSRSQAEVLTGLEPKGGTP